MEDILEDMPPVDIIPLEGPPNFVSPIIFFIMSSMSPPMSMPRDIMGGPPAPPGAPDVEVMVELEDEEEEKDMDDLVVPSGLWVEAAIIWDDSAESCLTEVLAPSGAVITLGAEMVRMPSAEYEEANLSRWTPSG